MATATKAPPASMEFQVEQDNGGSFRWTLSTPDGSVLARSRRFASRSEAEQAVQNVIGNAASATFAPATDQGRNGGVGTRS
jgi:uncharacterized protein YegP (UPF0339 family)